MIVKFSMPNNIKVLAETKPQPQKEWVHDKLHASDMGAILTQEKLNAVRFGKTTYSIIKNIIDYRENGVVPAETGSRFMDIGTEQETIIKDAYTKLTGKKILPAERVLLNDIVTGHPDGITEDGEIFEAKRVVFVPNVSPFELPDEHWFAEVVDDEVAVYDPKHFFDKLTEVRIGFIPFRYLVQSAIYAAALNVKSVIFGVQWHANLGAGVYNHLFLKINIADSLKQHIIDRATYYHTEFIEKSALPLPTTSEEIQEAFKVIDMENIAYIEELTAEEISIVQQFLEAKQQEKIATAHFENLRTAIIKILQENNKAQLFDKNNRAIYSGDKIKKINSNYPTHYLDELILSR